MGGFPVLIVLMATCVATTDGMTKPMLTAPVDPGRR